MAEKVTPAIKPVGKPDGIPSGGGHSTITTPNQSVNRKWSSGSKNIGKVMGK